MLRLSATPTPSGVGAKRVDRRGRLRLNELEQAVLESDSAPLLAIAVGSDAGAVMLINAIRAGRLLLGGEPIG